MPTSSPLSSAGPFTRAWLRSAKIRRAVALSAVVLATGGLVLYKAAPSAAFSPSRTFLAATGKNATSFDGPGAHGVLSLSHTKVLAGQTTPVYAEIRLSADAKAITGQRAPLSIAVVLDTSGSMSGEKLEDAKRSVLRLVSDMQDGDEIAVVRYAGTSELIQPLARVGEIRSSLSAKIRSLEADGGTNIPGGLSSGLRALDDAAKGRVRRIVLASDGLDSTRAQAESLASSSFTNGITVSSLGIGLDFDEGYMGGVAQSGHGNFAFVKDGSSLASFLKRELDETAATTLESARIDLQLPSGMRFVSATGAEATVHDGSVELRLGSLFAGDERRVIVELAAEPGANADLDLRADAYFRRVGETTTHVTVPKLSIVASSDASEVERGRDGAVFASAMSVLASKRQLEASSAYARGDVATWSRLSAENEASLGAALAAAPAPAAATISAQMNAYAEQKKTFHSARPESAQGRAAAKAGAMKDLGNLGRTAF